MVISVLIQYHNINGINERQTWLKLSGNWILFWRGELVDETLLSIAADYGRGDDTVSLESECRRRRAGGGPGGGGGNKAQTEFQPPDIDCAPQTRHTERRVYI